MIWQRRRLALPCYPRIKMTRYLQNKQNLAQDGHKVFIPGMEIQEISVFIQWLHALTTINYINTSIWHFMYNSVMRHKKTTRS